MPVAGIELKLTITLGELAVAAGTLLLAGFTYLLARATYSLDRRSAERERTRHQQRVLGVARLVAVDLIGIKTTLSLAIKHHAWQMFYGTPHAAWDRESTVLVAALPMADAQALIFAHGHLTRWEEVSGAIRSEHPDWERIELDEADLHNLTVLQASVEEATAILARLTEPP